MPTSLADPQVLTFIGLVFLIALFFFGRKIFWAVLLGMFFYVLYEYYPQTEAATEPRFTLMFFVVMSFVVIPLVTYLVYRFLPEESEMMDKLGYLFGVVMALLFIIGIVALVFRHGADTPVTKFVNSFFAATTPDIFKSR